MVLLPLLALAQKAPVDSTKAVAGIPVTHDTDTLFLIYSSIGPYGPAERAGIIQKRLALLMSDPTFAPDSVTITEGAEMTDLFYGDRMVMSVTDGDAAALKMTRKKASVYYLTQLKAKLREKQKSRNLLNTLLLVGLTLLELVILYLLIRFTNKLFNYTKRRLIDARKRILKGIRFKGYELLDTRRELQVALFINNLVRWAVIIIVLYLAIPILFSIFPWTRGLADKLFQYVLSPVKNIFWAAINYIPSLFTVAVIYIVTRYTVTFIRFLASEVQSGALVLPGFYPDWSMPTFNIVRVLLYAFMFVVIYPYLPGSESPIFQGVSVFLGVLFSLGSSSAISNLVAGLVITYMRPFKVGDRIKIGEITGDVIEKSMLVTRIRTTKNEDITMPNATVLSGHTINYTTSASELGLILYSSVTIGYDVPWKQVHELLISAAIATPGVIDDENRKPFVLQISLDDFYVSYQINAFTTESHQTASIYSALHQNIQDKFNEAGVEIMSPHYRATRDGNTLGIPPQYLPGNYEPPAFNVRMKPGGDDKRV